jgi:hypothetical protein
VVFWYTLSMGSDQKEIEILEEAILDVGNLIYWAEVFPDIFQLEFDCVQLWNPPIRDNESPSNIIALQFRKPTSVSFLTFNEETPEDWPEKMRKDEFGATIELIKFNDKNLIDEALSRVVSCKTIFGRSPKDNKFYETPYNVIIEAGHIGVAVAGESLTWQNHKEDNLPLSLVPERHKQWWEYWQAYWESKKGPNPMPYDWTCEITIPVSSE